jgi:hypothetical protein
LKVFPSGKGLVKKRYRFNQEIIIFCQKIKVQPRKYLGFVQNKKNCYEEIEVLLKK